MNEEMKELQSVEEEVCATEEPQKKAPAQKKERFSEKVKRTMAWMMACVLCFCIGVAAASLYEPSGTEEIRVSTSNVRTVIKKAGELVSTKYYYKDTSIYENTKKLFKIELPFATDMVVFTYEGTISLGIDMEKIKVDVNNEERTVTLTLPKIGIIGNELDHNSFAYPFEKDSVLIDTTMEDYTTLLGHLKDKKAADVLLDKELMETARTNTQQVLEKFLAGSDMIHGYQIIFLEVDET